jgi:hypothetical protein
MSTPRTRPSVDVLNKAEIEKLERKNQNVYLAGAGISLLGSVGGVIYASKTGKSFWGKVGWWFLGGIIVGVPAGITVRAINNKRLNQIDKLKSQPTQIFSTKAKQEEAASDACESVYESMGATAFNKCRKEFIENSQVG